MTRNTIIYSDADETKAPQAEAWNRPDPMACANDDLELTRPMMKPSLPKPDLMEMKAFKNESGVARCAWLTLRFQCPINIIYRHRCLHLHGFNMYLLHEGVGEIERHDCQRRNPPEQKRRPATRKGASGDAA
ncbi:Laccase-2 [Tolypocladium capitatum]|uniref:Laccase-2 n=1 Tax=Tolypocladium capitatum TaxID=45235 RepID=A0A2K3QKM0_9HYPO|nr:Laccase-2 [Tolypocladium capitatum]